MHGITTAGCGHGVTHRLAINATGKGACAIKGGETFGSQGRRFKRTDIQPAALRTGRAGKVFVDPEILPEMQSRTGVGQAIVIIGAIDKERIARAALAAATDSADNIGAIVIEEIIIFGNRPQATKAGNRRRIAGDNRVGDIQRTTPDKDRWTAADGRIGKGAM